MQKEGKIKNKTKIQLFRMALPVTQTINKIIAQNFHFLLPFDKKHDFTESQLYVF